MLLVGTHKDQVEDPHAALLGKAQELVAGYITDMHIAKETTISQHISKPAKRKWFFAVDSRSRKTIAGKVRSSDGTLAEVRNEMKQVVKKDKRKVTGLCVGGI